MKKGLSVLLAVMMMCSFTVSSWAAETSNEAPPTDMQECCEETMYAGGREVFTDNSGVMRVIEGKDIGGAVANVPIEIWSSKELEAGLNVRIEATWTPAVASIKVEILSDDHAIMTMLRSGESRDINVIYSDVYRVVITPVNYNIVTGSLTFRW